MISIGQKWLRSWSITIRQIFRRKGFLWRGLLCWLIGVLVLFNDEISSFDARFQFRGDQSKSEDIIVINFKTTDIINQSNLISSFGPLHEIADVTDSFFWDQRTWFDLLKRILASRPKAVGVSLFFSESLGPLSLSAEEKKIFNDPRVSWASSVSTNDRPLPSLMGGLSKNNIGTVDMQRDDDGVVRRFFVQKTIMPHLAEKLAGKNFPILASPLLNFRGSNNVFVQYSVLDIINNKVPLDALKNKIIIIGADGTTQGPILTPFGLADRAIVVAHMVDSLKENRWIFRFSFLWYAALLALVMILSVLLMASYPQSVAFFLLFWLGTLFSSLSAWVFDSYFIWTPVTSTLVVIVSVYVIFLGYQANTIERKHFQLTQEQKYLRELEQLKNNFVSLISHDLKTPIAKIQATLDRVMLSEHAKPLSEDLNLLKKSGEELNKYIESILKVLRVESRDFRLHIEVGDINDLISDAVNTLAPLAKEKNIQLNLELEPLFSMEMDITLIREVLINIIENAIKYSQPGGYVKVTSFEVEDQVQIEVEDSGAGIPKDEMAHVWGKFVRGKNQDLKTKGTGLGLYLVKFFIELHGGKVWMESQVDRGTKVTFTLPLESVIG